MSQSDPEGYEPCTYQRHRVRSRKRGKHGTVIEGTFITKTFYDPSKSLSKSSKKRVLCNQLDELCPYVPYSLNKRERWKLNIRSFLESRHPSLSQSIETLLIKKLCDQVTPIYSESGSNEKICKIELVQNDDVTVLSSGGKTMPMRYYSDQIRTLRHMDKKEVEPSRVLYNITVPSSSKAKSKKLFRKSYRRCVVDAEFDRCDENEDYSDNLIEISDCEPDLPLREITLADYLNPKGHQENRNLHDKSKTISASNCHEDGIEKQLTNPPSPSDKNADASLLEVVVTPHIFDVLEIFTEQRIELQEVLHSVPQWLIARSFGSQRLFISSPPISKPVFVLFFEIEEEHKIFRIRISTDSSYSHGASRSRLLDTIFRRKIDVSLLFSNLHVFILQTEVAKPVEPRFGSRFNLYPENFEIEVNSRMISPKVGRFVAQELISHPELLSFRTSSISKSIEADHSTECIVCKCSSRTDLFPTTNGLMCRQCVAASIIHQLRHNLYPIEIPVITTEGISPLEQLYAILPLPLMTFLLQKSFTSANPQLKLEKCPHCSVTLVIPPVCEYNSCSCSNCGCVFCYLCKWEPHWPMNCGQFKQWSAKWDTHYLFECNNVFEDKQVRICCECGGAFHVDKNSAEPIRCPAPNCWWSYDENGIHRHYHKYVPASTPKVTAHLTALGEPIKPCPECGRRLEPNTVEAKSIIDKNFSSLCSEGRKQRMHKRGEFEKFIFEVFSTKKEQLSANDLRKTVLFLVENCTALLYITKPDNCYAMRKEVANLLRNLLLIQSRTSAITRGEFITEMNKLRESTGSLIELFRKFIKIE